MMNIGANSKVRSTIMYYVGTAAAIGASPVPCMDTILLTGMQMKMMRDIMKAYDIPMNKMTIFEEVVRAKISILLNRVNINNMLAVAGNLLKFFSGAGTILGGAVNATAASSITYTMGNCLVDAAEMILKNGWRDNPEMIAYAVRKAI